MEMRNEFLIRGYGFEGDPEPTYCDKCGGIIEVGEQYLKRGGDKVCLGCVAAYNEYTLRDLYIPTTDLISFSEPDLEGEYKAIFDGDREMRW